MRAVRVAREFDELGTGKLQDLLELPADVQQDILAFLLGAALASSNVAVATAGDALADGTGPDTNTVEALADVDHDAHDLAIALLLEGLADGREHDVQPQVVDGDGALLLERVRPLSSVLVLLVLPFGPHTFLEEVVVGFESELRHGGNVVLDSLVSARIAQRQEASGKDKHIRRRPRTPRQS